MESITNFGDTLFWFLVLLTPLVFVHELGHYLVARWNGVRVDVFSIGFGPELFGWNDRKGTRWKISAIPLGGYIKMFGEHMLEADHEGRVREMTPGEKAVAFDQKRLGQRAAIVFAGPAANYLFAIVVLALMFVSFGQYYTPPEVGNVPDASAAAEAGLRPGDMIVRIEGREIERYESFQQLITMSPGRPLEIEILRDGELIEVTAVPRPTEVEAIDGTTQTIGDLGIRPRIAPVVGRVVEGGAAEAAGFRAGDLIVSIDGRPIDRFEQLQEIVAASSGEALDVTVRREGSELTLTATPAARQVEAEDGSTRTIGQLGIVATRPSTLIRLGPLEAAWQAVDTTAERTLDTLRVLGQIIVGQRETKEVGGPIMIAMVSGEVAKAGIVAFMELMVLFSINLGLINLFPIPVLDGGHLAFYAIEAVRGRPLGERAQEFGFKIGLALVLSLMIFVTVNDLLHRVF